MRPKSCGRSPRDSGQCVASSPVTNGRSDEIPARARRASRGRCPRAARSRRTGGARRTARARAARTHSRTPRRPSRSRRTTRPSRSSRPRRNGAEERLVLARARSGVRAREDRSGRLAPELLDGDPRVLPARRIGSRSSMNARTSGRSSYSDGPRRSTCSSNANGSSAPSSSSRPRTTNDPSTKPRRSGYR